MALKIVLGQTKLDELHKVFNLSSKELNDKKARLFPTGNSDSETSTVSIFLASLSAVKEYREELFLTLGINKIKARNVNVHSYVEIEDGNKNNRPDGLIVITSGKNNPIIEWAGFIEAKISENMLEDEQIERYSDFAREIGINDIITISNFLVTSPIDSPIKSKKRNFKFYHWSWAYLKVTALRLIRTDCIEDIDHVFILTELRRYFDSHKNLRNFIYMGKEWKDSVSAINSYNADDRIKENILSNIVAPLVQEEKDISLQLTDKSKYLISLNAKNNRQEDIENMLQKTKVVTSSYIINNYKNNTFSIDIDFLRQEIRCYTSIIIDKGKSQAQTSSLIKMLENDSGYQENIFINAIYIRNKSLEKDTVTLSDLVNEKDDDNINNYAILDKKFGDSVKYFEIKTKDKLGKNFTGSKSFISNLEEISERFLNQVMENILR